MKRTFARAVLVATLASGALVDARAVFASVQFYGCTDCPLRVPELGSRGVVLSTLEVASPGRIGDLDIFVDIEHSFIGDLEIFLRGPGAVEVQLFDNVGLSGDHIRAVTFDDEALLPISRGSPPFGPGRYRPVPGELAWFDGLELHGRWTLVVADRFFGDSGTLLDWGIGAVTVFEPPATGLLAWVLGFGWLARWRRRIYPREDSRIIDGRGTRFSAPF